MTEHERRRALAESLQEAIEHPARRASDLKHERETSRQEVVQRRRRGAGILLLLTWGVLGWLWLAKPEFVFSPSLGQAEGARFSAEEGLRYGMYLQAARIREFQAEHGRLPASIAEAGEAEAGLEYVVEGGRWTLRGTADGTELELTSEMSPEGFLRSEEGR